MGVVTVLVVDNEAGIRTAVERILRAAGYSVIGAGGVTDALQLLATVDVDIVLLDAHLDDGPPERVLAALPNRAVVLMFSGDSWLPLPERASGRVPKPFRRDELVQTVASALMRG